MVLAFGVVMAWQGWVLVMQDIDRAIPMLDIAESWRALPMVDLRRADHHLLLPTTSSTASPAPTGAEASWPWDLALLFGLFFFGLIVGVPVAFALGIAAVATFVYEGLPLFVAFQRILSGISVYSLLAIPFFIFAGELMLHGGIATRLVRFAAAAVGSMRGGLGMVNVLASMLFGGISGSAVADTSALGSILMPVMKEKGYDADYAVNVTVTSSVAGVVIPPSHNMILYAVAAGGGISVGKLFIAGVVPGVLMCLCLAVAAYLVAVRRGYGVGAVPGLAGAPRQLHRRRARPADRRHHRRRRAVRHPDGDRVRRLRRDLRHRRHRPRLSRADLGRVQVAPSPTPCARRRW